jgi:hypothetical protein
MFSSLEIRQELDWLRYLYYRAKDAMGPADGEIYQMIKEDYVDAGHTLPEEYALEEPEEEEDE